ncbi:MAG TPA: B12-binding domain-containing radical SAM protein [Prolixibacteraceae bacterium]|nr:B12-binding domain-containing radical SAM protein [Prolixibacteraceae bacterium]
MNVLLVYPQYPDSFWSFKHVMRFIAKKATVPPLGLITVSAMLPKNWHKKLVDLNVTTLQVKDILWADYVFISAMYIQRESVNKIIELCLKYEVKIIAGGPLFTQEYEDYPQISHFILNEAEITMPLFLNDLNAGKKPEKVYKTNDFADITKSPVPDYCLLSIKDYVTMNIQVSRGCPFSCDFCEITSLLGHRVRMKNTSQIIEELEILYHLNWRGPILIVDDNFIGNKYQVKNNLLPAMKKWMQNHKYPFTFNIQSSINLADDEKLMSLMTETGFTSTFVGIETPDEKSLQECNKGQNKNRDLLESVKKMQNSGLQVSGGFIVGFDSDTPTVFQKQIDFIQQSGIVSAMVGLLNAPKNTVLYKRLKAENRLTSESSGNNTDSSMNFVPVMNHQELLDGYKKIIQNIYSAKPYYKRIRQFLLNYKKLHAGRQTRDFPFLLGFIKSVIIIGIVSKGRSEYWKLLIWTLFRRPALITDALTFSVYGYHFRTIYGLNNKF